MGVYNQSYDRFDSQASSVRVTNEFNQKVADAWEEIQVENITCLLVVTNKIEFQTVNTAKQMSTA